MEDVNKKDFFIDCPINGKFLGRHLLIDVQGATNLDKLDVLEKMLVDCVDAAGATLLHIHLHHFTPNGGVSGVAVLAESHISIHTWPEYGYAALDVFMCGSAKPELTVAVIEQTLFPTSVKVEEVNRGQALFK